ncbi:MAG: HD-GYP domain-containing protein [Candidatus Aminicenantales bacterium]
MQEEVWISSSIQSLLHREECFWDEISPPKPIATSREMRQASRKVVSAKNILRGISRSYEAVFEKGPRSNPELLAEKQLFLNSNILYLIAATDGNEDALGHSQLVARYTLMLARSLEIQEREFLRDIERGALLHDIGKIGIPEAILRKPGPLDEKERAVIREHPLLGYEILEEFLFLRKAARVVLYHHETYDGRGYPYGLSSEDIPLEARIFAVADTLDAITSDRPYRKGESFQKAFDEIERGRGSQFDPEVVDALLRIPEDEWRKAKTETEASLKLHTVH